jgi:hypothetical protein
MPKETPAKDDPKKKAQVLVMPKLKVAPMRRGLAVDSATAPTQEQAQALYDLGVRTWFRYVDRVPQDPDTDNRWPINLTRPELAMLLGIGFDVGLVQYYSTGYESQLRGERICGAYGEQLGAVASANARALGVPPGITIFCDAEDWIRLRSKLHGEQFLRRWMASNEAAGDEGGLYHGANLGNERAGWLTGQQLYDLPHVRAYWSACGDVPQIPRRGHTITQSPPVKVKGLEVDFNTVRLDALHLSSRYRFKVIRRAA